MEWSWGFRECVLRGRGKVLNCVDLGGGGGVRVCRVLMLRAELVGKRLRLLVPGHF